MTLYIPLDLKSVHPNSPSFLVASPTPERHLAAAVQSILKAKRIAVVCGAGISVGAGIPDFRSQDGLFQSLKRDNPKESLSSGKDLFDASVFKSTQKTALFYRMIASLASLSSQGRPTVFHQLLRTLDERGQLLRVYTQNIDALEMKAGLSFGVPEFEEKKLRLFLKGKAKAKAKEAGIGAYNAKHGSGQGKRPSQGTAVHPPLVESSVSGLLAPPRTGILPFPNIPAKPQLNVIPRCIPLHGTLLTLHCPHCTQSFPLEPPLPDSVTPISPPPSPNGSSSNPSSSSPSPLQSLHSLLADGTPPPCPSCASLEQTRALVGKRLRGVGRLRPSVVLYGEEHREGEGVGEAVRRDLCGIADARSTSSGVPDKEKSEHSSPSKSRPRAGKGPDLLLVVGTSLRVPGTKRIVREFSKAVRPLPQSPSPSRMSTPTPTPSPPAPAGEGKLNPIRTIYLNNEFPLSSREWEGVFDVWINGDVQAFAKMMEDVIQKQDEQKNTRQKQKLNGAAMAKEQPAVAADSDKLTSEVQKKESQVKGKRKADVLCQPSTPSKRLKPEVVIPPTPVSLSRPGPKTAAIIDAPRSQSQSQYTLHFLPPKLFETGKGMRTPQSILPLSPPKPIEATIIQEKPPRTPPSRRRVTLRLPPAPGRTPESESSTLPGPRLKRKHSSVSNISAASLRKPEVTVPSTSTHHKPYRIARHGSLSPLTSLSTLSSPASPTVSTSSRPNGPNSPLSEASRASMSSSKSSNATVRKKSLWRDNVEAEDGKISSIHRNSSINFDLDIGQSNDEEVDEEDIHLSTNRCSPLPRGHSHGHHGAAGGDGFSSCGGSSWQLPVYA